MSNTPLRTVKGVSFNGSAPISLGTAAVLNAGTSANQLVQITADGKLPAIDGSLLTGINAVPSTRTISAAGLATGGGALSSNQTITVTESSDADTWAGIEAGKATTPRRLATALAWLALGSTGTVAWNVASAINFTIDMTGNVTLSAPTGLANIIGRSGILRVKQDTVARILGFDATYDGDGDVIGAVGTTINKYTYYTYLVTSSSRLLISLFAKNVSH